MGEAQNVPLRYITILSLASAKHGVRMIPVADLHGHFRALREEFPTVAPPVGSRELFDRFLYSRLIGTQEELGAGFSIDEMAKRRMLEIPEYAGKRNLEDILVEHGEIFVRPLLPVARRFAELVAERQAVRA